MFVILTPEPGRKLIAHGESKVVTAVALKGGSELAALVGEDAPQAASARKMTAWIARLAICQLTPGARDSSSGAVMSVRAPRHANEPFRRALALIPKREEPDGEFDGGGPAPTDRFKAIQWARRDGAARWRARTRLECV